MKLIDTNIFLEILLNQPKAYDARMFLENQNLLEIFMSDFTLHSIGVILFRPSINQRELYIDFVDDVIIHGGIRVLPLSTSDSRKIVTNSKQFQLDFDDAYQYTMCKKYNLDVVSFDSDFDRTDLVRLVP